MRLNGKEVLAVLLLISIWDGNFRTQQTSEHSN
ncbi:hypothetical protein N579_12575 [Corynebacterium pseudodiphtheriticum 090104]|nr:hypothetical protein N579_12575 [Corynebacterium pseudodiphtheriticum 090104]